MIALRLAATELRRLTAGRLPRIAVLAVVLVPLLYGGFYLYANWDPYGNFDQVPAALVVEDAGATAHNKPLHAGAEVAADLLKRHNFDWHEVSAAQADTGVRDGRYTFAVTLPVGFSEALVSPIRPAEGKAAAPARQGMLILTTNDANSYTGSSAGRKVVEEVRRTVAVKVGAEAAEQLLAGFTVIAEKTQEAVDGSVKLAAGAATAADGAGTLADGGATLASGVDKLRDGSARLDDATARAADGARQLGAGAGRLDDGLGRLRAGTADLPVQTARLALGARQVSDGNAQLNGVAQTVAKNAQDFTNLVTGDRAALRAELEKLRLDPALIDAILAKLDPFVGAVTKANADVQSAAGKVGRLAAGADQVASGAERLAAATPALTTGVAQAADGAHQLHTTTNTLAAGLADLHRGAGDLHAHLGEAAGGAHRLSDGGARLRAGTREVAGGAHRLSDALAKAVGQVPNPDEPTRKATARVIADPVAIRGVGQATAETYGAGLAPFFLGLALWVGAFTLFMLVRPLSRRALAAGQRAASVALGGWLPAAAMGLAQVGLLFVFAVVLIGVSPAHPVAMLAFMLLTALAFTAVVHALNAFFGPAGKFLALVLLVLQLTSAGGTFPWQTTPEPLHPLHTVLPLSYVVDGLRQLLYGGGLTRLGLDVAVLIGYLVAGLALSSVAGRRHRIWTGPRLRPELVL